MKIKKIATFVMALAMASTILVVPAYAASNTTTKVASDGTKTVTQKTENKTAGTSTVTVTVTSPDGRQSIKKTETVENGSVTITDLIKETNGVQEVTIYGDTLEGKEGIMVIHLDKTGKKTLEIEYDAFNGEAVVSRLKTSKSSFEVTDTIDAGGKSFKVTQIFDEAFLNNKKLTKVEIGKYVKFIGSDAFNGDSKLKNITINTAITNIESGAFEGISKNAVFKIKASEKDYEATKAAIKKAGAPTTAKFKRIK